jgi:4-amino-4-deoxy-L-arabinose transferase-like glycosyltransferase
MNKKLFLILLFGLLLRLYCINSPFLDALAERQTQVALVAHNFFTKGFDFLHPEINIFGPNSGPTILEFPLIPALASILYNFFGEHEFLSRLLCIFFSILTLFFLYKTALKFVSNNTSLLVLLLAAISPMDIYFSRAFMSESSMMFFSITSFYTFLEWNDRGKNKFLVYSLICVILAIITKPPAAIILAPILSLWFYNEKFKIFINYKFWFYVINIILFFSLWFLWAKHVNSSNKNIPLSWAEWSDIITKFGSITDIWLNPDFYKNISLSIFLLLFTPIGTIGMLFGLKQLKTSNNKWIFIPWLMAIIFSLFFLSGAHMGHPYYQLPFLHFGLLLFGIGIEKFISHKYLDIILRNTNIRFIFIISSAFVLTTSIYAYKKYFNYMYNTNSRMPYVLEVSKIIKDKTNINDCLVINQPSAMKTVLTYYSDRSSFDFSPYHGDSTIISLESYIKRGGTIYVALDTKYASGMQQSKQNILFWKYLTQTYDTIAYSEHYAIFNLKTKKYKHD